jgi:hypothetical protein
MMTRFRAWTAGALCLVALLMSVASCGDDSTAASTGNIAGTITFRNTWPATGAIFVTVFSTYPPTGAPDSFTSPITENMLGPGRTYNYAINGLETHTYKAVLIGWRGGVGNDQCIGMYWAYPDSLGVGADCVAQPPGPAPVTVKKDQTVKHVDMVADLSLVTP